MARLVWIVAVLACSVVGAEDGDGITRAELKAWNAGPGKELAKNYTKKQVAELEKKLEHLKDAKVNSRAENGQTVTIRNKQYLAFKTTKDKNAAIDEVKKQIVAEKESAAEVDYPYLLVRNLSVGRIGRLAFQLEDGPQVVSSEVGVPITVVQVVDDKNLIGRLGTEDNFVWLTTSTVGVVDDQKYAMIGRLVEVVGTKQYTTVAGGTKTVFHLVERTVKDLSK